MAKRNSGVSKAVESWTLNKGTKNEVTETRIAVRHADGRFHGATNFKTRVR